MKTSTRIFPVFALVAAACGQSSRQSEGGNRGAFSQGGANPATGGSATGGTSGSSTGTGGASGSSTGTGGTSGSSTGTGGASGSGTGASSGSNATATGGSSAGGMSGGGAGGMSGDGGTAANVSGSGGVSTAGQGQGGSAGVATCPSLPTATVAANDIVQFNDNGGWAWFQDERALVDMKGGKFVIGSVASGGPRDSDQEVVIYDIASKDKQRFTLETDLNVDDHNAPAFFLRPDGGYAALWATHRDTCFSYYSTFDGTAWTPYKTYDWTPDGCPWDDVQNHQVTYANPWYLSAESKAFAGVRSVSTSPALLVSSDAGSSWSFYGSLISTPTVGFISGYYKYWGNGTDRIDFVGTEGHPRDADNNLWHGYYKGGKLYDSTDQVVDDNAGDTTAEGLTKFTKVFATGTALNGMPLYRMWNHDIARFADGTIVILGQGRSDNQSSTPTASDPTKHHIYARWNGTAWTTTYLVKSGPRLFPDEQDFTGLSAVDPDNPNIIYVSTTFDPRDNTTQLAKHEIFMGVTCDGGVTFKWAPITEGSTVDNIRPIVPKWDGSHTLLLWMKGIYNASQSYTMEIVGTTALPTAK